MNYLCIIKDKLQESEDHEIHEYIIYSINYLLVIVEKIMIILKIDLAVSNLGSLECTIKTKRVNNF